jgi:hypothetical protein
MVELTPEDWLNAPIIIWPGQSLPQPLKEDIIKQRMENNCSETTDAEVVAYMSTTSLAFPFDGETFNVYMHVFCKWLTWKGLNPDDYDFLEKQELNYCEKELLTKLKNFIFQNKNKNAIKTTNLRIHGR